MIAQGNEAIQFLSERLDADEGVTSSHWEKYHSNFKYDDGKLSGLAGFGGTGRQRTLMRSSLHRLLQIPFRKYGRDYQSFSRLDQLADTLTKRQHRNYNLDVLRQTISASFIDHHVGNKIGIEAICCVIGDGFATLSSLLIGSNLAHKVILVNLSKTLLVDVLFYQRAVGEAQFKREVVEDHAGMASALSDPHIRLIAVQASNHCILQKCPIDVFVNIASMQEMNPTVVAQYFDDFRESTKWSKKTAYLYCCNRVEKTLEDGTVVNFSNYPWQANDVHIVDELCPWHQKFYSTRPPFYCSYDGPVMHRLTHLSP